MDFSQYGEPVDFSAGAEPVDLSEFGEPVDSIPSAKGNLGESARRAGTDILTAADMIASLPGFALKVGERGMYSIFAALESADNPLELANKIAEDAYSQGWRKWTMTPIESTLEALGVKTSKEGTVSGEALEEFGKAVESGAKTVSEKTGSSELGEAGKQLLDVGMLGLGAAGIRAAKPRGTKIESRETIDDVLRNWKKPQENQFVQDPADMFPETLETPYGTITGQETGWSVDANGIPINRARTDELQATEAASLQREMTAPSGETSLGVHQRVPEEGTFTPSRDFELEPRPASPEAQMGLPWEQVDPANLKTTTDDLFTPEMQGQDFRNFATPEQGIEHIQTIPTDVTPIKGEPFQPDLPGTNKPLGGTGKKGFGQGGSWTPFAGKEKTLEDRAKTMKKDEWITAFNDAYPGHENMAADMYDRFSRISAAPKSSRMGDAVGAVTDTLDKALGSISTRLGNIDPQVKQQLIDFEIYNSKNSGNRLDRVDKFLDDIYTNFPLKEDQATVKSLLLRNDFNTLEKVSPDSFKKELGELRSVLDQTGDELVKYGIIESKRENYFPRIVNDLKGLYKAMGVEQAQGLQKLIRDKERAGGPLSDIELADITNRYIQNNFRRSAKPGFSRERKLADVPPEWEQFYAEPAEALHTYLRSATFQIERAKFFGKNAERDPLTGRINVEQSIGNLLVDLVNKKRIKPEQVEDVASIIRSRFGSGQSQSNAFWQGYKDLTHFATLGDIGNTAMQLADLAVIAALDGIRPTMVGIARRFGGDDPIRAKDFGLMNRISDDFVSDRATTRLVNATFKYTGLSKVDEAVKDVLLNAYYDVGRREALSGKSKSTLFTEYRDRFGDEFPQLVKDLKEGNRTELTDRFVLSELANRQPIFKSEYSQAYLDNPNAVRPALVLTSFMLKSADFMRLRAYNQIKSGNKAQGYANLAKIATGLALGNVAMDTIRDYIANRPVDEVGAKQIAAAMAGVFRFNEYFTQDIQQGAWGEAAMGLVAPPIRTALDQIGGDLAPLWDEDKEFKGKTIKLIPLVGDELYGWSDYGQEARAKQERRMSREEMKE